MCHTFYGFAPGDFTEIENILDVGVHEYGSKVCQEKWLETKICNWVINWKSITKKFTHFAVWVDTVVAVGKFTSAVLWSKTVIFKEVYCNIKMPPHHWTPQQFIPHISTFERGV